MTKKIAPSKQITLPKINSIQLILENMVAELPIKLATPLTPDDCDVVFTEDKQLTITTKLNLIKL